MSAVLARRFASADELADTLAAEITAALNVAIKAGSEASLAVPGGRTPAALFDRLSSASVDWRRVWITLTDERWVGAADNSSNEHLVREHLLRARAANAHFAGLKSAFPTPAAGAAASWSGLQQVPRPFECVVLGMGDDGHFASLFPQTASLALALDAAQPPACVAMTAAVAPHQRISLNLAALLQTRRIVLLIVGAQKWSTYERACQPGSALEMPVRALLQQSQVPVAVYWSP